VHQHQVDDPRDSLLLRRAAALSAAGAFGMLALCAFPRAVSPAPASGG
jgi:hypothetical protein